MKIDVITIFPGMFDAVLGESIVKRAQVKGKAAIRVHDLRGYTHDRHKKVDDRPFGGGSGMVMSAQPIYDAVEALAGRRKNAHVVLLSPQGRTFSQAKAKELARKKHLVLVCGHYEGVDERVRTVVDEEISIGDYVLTGGELPAMVLIDSVVRLIPGVLGDKNSLKFESFEGNLLEYPQYTRPACFRAMKVPAVLLSGNHPAIEAWRQAQAVAVTRQKRPDLLSAGSIKKQSKSKKKREER